VQEENVGVQEGISQNSMGAGKWPNNENSPKKDEWAQCEVWIGARVKCWRNE